MKNSWYKSNYISWNVNLAPFKNTTLFDKQLDSAFIESAKKGKPPEANGLAYSAQIKNLDGFQNLLDFLSDPLYTHLKDFDSTNMIARSWANRMHNESFGSLHKHGTEVKVFILYYNVPDNSSDLVLVHPKHQLSNIKNPEQIPMQDKKHIQVTEGMCILHDGDILHGVSTHKSEFTRDAIIIEFFANRQ
jgi:hypothetical protein